MICFLTTGDPTNAAFFQNNIIVQSQKKEGLRLNHQRISNGDIKVDQLCLRMPNVIIVSPGSW